MLYGIEDKPPVKELLLFSLQMLLSVFVATALIASICGVEASAGIVGAGIGCLVYSFVTRGKSPMFCSNSGAFVAPVLLALGAAGYGGVAVGGVTACIVYCVFGLIFTKVEVANIYKVFPPTLIGAITCVIGINLMGFIGGYIGNTGHIGVMLAMITMVVTAVISHYAKGLFRVLPFLLGILAGYAVALVITLTGVAPIVDFSVFEGVKLFSMPTFAFTQWNFTNFSTYIPIIVVYIAYTISAMCECLSDHAALSGITGTDLYKNPGLSKIFIGEGLANLASAFVGGLNSCSYGESIATIGFSKVASTIVTRVAALMLIFLGFIGYVNAFIASIPSCVFAGSAIILYGYIACSGVRMLQKVDFNNQKSLVIVSVTLSTGISGLVIGGLTFNLTGTALALVVGIILNQILKEK